MSDEFVEVILGKLMEALRPSPFDQLDEPTLNAGLALPDRRLHKSSRGAPETAQAETSFAQSGLPGASAGGP
jgi:hypothetical protein